MLSAAYLDLHLVPVTAELPAPVGPPRADLGREMVAHLPELRRQAQRLTRDAREADDLVQETLARALHHQGQFRQGTHLRAWLGRILANTFVNAYRRRQRQLALVRHHGEQIWLGHPFGHLAADNATEMESVSAGPPVSETLRRALDSLPDAYRDVVLMYDLLDYSYAEIAASLGVPAGTVMSRLFRGRRLLRRRLRAHVQEVGCVSAAALEAAETTQRG